MTRFPHTLFDVELINMQLKRLGTEQAKRVTGCYLQRAKRGVTNAPS